MDYKKKYFKYKYKYLELQKQIGGVLTIEEKTLLKEKGFTDIQVVWIEKFEDKQKFYNAIDLKNKNFNCENSWWGAKELTGNIDEGQIKRAIELKNKGFYDTIAISIAKLINNTDKIFNNAIELKQVGFTDDNVLNIIGILKDDETRTYKDKDLETKMKNAIELKKVGFSDDNALNLSDFIYNKDIFLLTGNKDNGQIKIAIQLKKIGFSDDNSAKGARILNRLTLNKLNTRIKKINEEYIKFIKKTHTPEELVHHQFNAIHDIKNIH
jgi:hypothetical protein